MNDATLDTSTVQSPTTTSRPNGRARSASGPTDEAVGPARPATSGPTAPTVKFGRATSRPFVRIPGLDLTSDESGSESAAGAVRDVPIGDSSSISSPPSGHWNEPQSIMELIAQANAVATLVLNSEIPIVTARTYASVGRTVAGLLKAEIDRRRFVDGPDIDFPVGRVRS